METRVAIHGLARAKIKPHQEKVVYSDNLAQPKAGLNRSVQVADVLRETNRFPRATQEVHGGCGIGRFSFRRHRHQSRR